MTATAERLDPASVESEPTKDELIAELRQLVADLRDAAQDGRLLAARYSDLLIKGVEEYCVEFEMRAQRAIERLERVSK